MPGSFAPGSFPRRSHSPHAAGDRSPHATMRSRSRGAMQVSLHEREGSSRAGLEFVGEQAALTVRKGPQWLGFADVITREELSTARGAPPTLAHQQLSDCPADCLVGGVQDHIRRGCFSLRDPSLELRAGEPDRIGSFQCPQSLRRRGHRGGLTHVVLRFLPFGPRGHGRVYERTGVLEGPLPWVLISNTARPARTCARFMSPPIRPSLPTEPPALRGRFGRSRSYAIRAGNSNVTCAGHALRACFLCRPTSCASVDKPGRGNDG